ncbi:MAG: ribosome silencing factor [Desulfobulbaceae bacterium DB1]|nr:MAG: ribosome silencing factor [Desulfobulbaceae bacterium DB1]
MKRTPKKYQEKSSLELARIISGAALDKKAEDLVILDVHELSSFTDYFVIMSGRSTRHVQGLADAIESELRLKRLQEGTTEGAQEGFWVLLDYGDVVVHIFYHEERAFYDLEGLWHDAPRIGVEEE